MVERLKEVGEIIKLSKPHTSLPKVEPPHKKVTVKTSSTLSQNGIANENILDLNLFTSWNADEIDENPWIELDFGQKETFNYFSMHAGYKKSIQKYKIEVFLKNKWVHLFTGGPATFHEKHPFKEVKAQKFRLQVLENKGIPEIVELTFVKY
ncbi:discoidin domain-containing protein [Seonamhaeicola maritimus]|uniref:discoidin domain-containing protein n=1 Tax=Seonamhaeicola maritimus TaxID=2591822 RepID=UPI002494E920|nr:discoidin domain-containing protein [Seonamhaeicola maritimus]